MVIDTNMHSAYLQSLRKIGDLEKENKQLKAEVLKLKAEKVDPWVQAQIDYDRFDG